MAKSETITARLPRGARPVSQAFFSALEKIPETSRAAVTKAAQMLIRDQIKMQNDKAKATAAKEKAGTAKDKARQPVLQKPMAARKASPKIEVAAKTKAAPVKRRSRKPAEAPVAA